MTIATQLKSSIAKTRALAANTRTKATALGTLAFVSAGSAFASGTETSAAQQAFDELQSQAADMASSAWPVVTAIVGSLLAIGLFKKFAHKAS
ncbi:hypothetical protein GCM10027040_05270 [Halomonas shantousis]